MNRVFVKKDDPLYKYALDFMERSWGTKGKGIFPGCQPISIEREHFNILSNNDYVVCEKTDGTRYMMIAIQYGMQKLCIFVNRALEMFVTPLNFRAIVFKGTILEGELYENTFMIYDCLLSCGEVVGNKDFLERLEYCEKIMKKAMVLKTDVLTLQVKKFHLHQDFKAFMDKYLPKVKQEIDGLIFTPVNEPIRIGTHETMFKWKPRNKNTIDFLVKRGPTAETPGCVPGQYVWRLYIQDRGKHIFESSIPVDRMQDYTWLRDGDIVECMYVTWEKGPLWWKPIKKRTDKTFPNSRRTFYRTLVNIKEDIQMKEFLDCKPK
jgi:hypothetical protein|tara:strand:- start:2255 stop:3217 length:963 start_codon:yes stop_codon:yes gene_type:complete